MPWLCSRPGLAVHVAAMMNKISIKRVPRPKGLGKKRRGARQSLRVKIGQRNRHHSDLCCNVSRIEWGLSSPSPANIKLVIRIISGWRDPQSDAKWWRQEVKFLSFEIHGCCQEFRCKWTHFGCAKTNEGKLALKYHRMSFESSGI